MKYDNPSEFALAVKSGTAGLKFISSGICPGCETCRDELGYNSLEELQIEWDNGITVCDPHFSWQSCECCGSTLGGDREPAHGVDENGDIVHFEICVDCIMYLANGDEPESWEG